LPFAQPALSPSLRVPRAIFTEMAYASTAPLIAVSRASMAFWTQEMVSGLRDCVAVMIPVESEAIRGMEKISERTIVAKIIVLIFFIIFFVKDKRLDHSTLFDPLKKPPIRFQGLFGLKVDYYRLASVPELAPLSIAAGALQAFRAVAKVDQAAFREVLKAVRAAFAAVV